jgi:hypothetical protein
VTQQATRRARILRVRAIEHRAATARLVTVDETIKNLARISERLFALRQSLVAQRSDVLGLTLKAKAEMSHRLASATASLVQPINDAEQARGRANSERLVARRREDSASKLYVRSVRTDEQKSYARESAVRPFRTHSNRLGKSA